MLIEEQNIRAVATLLDFLSKKIIASLESDNPIQVVLEMVDLTCILSADQLRSSQNELN